MVFHLLRTHWLRSKVKYSETYAKVCFCKTDEIFRKNKHLIEDFCSLSLIQPAYTPTIGAVYVNKQYAPTSPFCSLTKAKHMRRYDVRCNNWYIFLPIVNINRDIDLLVMVKFLPNHNYSSSV